MPTERIIELLMRYEKGTLSAEEQRLLDDWFEQHGKRENTLEEMSAAARETWIKALYADIQASNRENETPTKLITRIRQWFPYAAAILIIATTATIWFFRQDGFLVNRDAADAPVADVQPGGNRATLTLANGKTITLNEAQNGIVVNDGTIRYRDDAAEIYNLSSETIDQLVLSTPKGGTYQLTLPDGSDVWLNAASTLTYPSRFTGDERIVYLEGEAYFSVRRETKGPLASQHVPFKVVSKGQTIEVLGTEFNLSAYADDGQTVTTLVNGAVRVLATEQSEELALTKGEQSVLEDKAFTKSQVDIEPFVLWKSGHFCFRETEMRQVMKQLSRWYDVDVIIGDDIPPTYFYADIKRDKSLAQVLNILEKGGVNFRIVQNSAGPQIEVMP